MAKKPKSICNILMYSHDTYGLGHIRRTLAIASQLAGPQVNILILTGSPLAGRFNLGENIDFVRIPGMIKKTNEEYLPLSIRINPDHALCIRKNIITATAKAFAPQIFIVDKEPLGLKKEVLPTLLWMKSRSPNTRTILGLRDVMDDAETVKRDWEEKGVYSLLDELYSEIWVYGDRSFYDPGAEYAVPGPVNDKMIYTGYIPRQVPEKSAVARLKSKLKVKANERLVAVTTGGGGDGAAVIRAYLDMLESSPVDFKSVLVTGPFMPRKDREAARKRAEHLNVQIYGFFPRMEEVLAAADLVVSMGGYNTVCEIMTQKTVSLLIPRENPRQEQLIRARILAERNLADYIPLSKLSPALLREKIFALLDNPEPYQKAIAGFPLTGISAMQDRVAQYCVKN